MSVSRVHIAPEDFISSILREVVKRDSGLTPDEMQELAIRCDTAYDISSMRTRFRIRWLNGHENMRQLDFFMDEDMQGITKNTEMVAKFAAMAMEQANLRGELQFHRLEQRMPKRIKEVRVGPTVHEGEQIPAGKMCIIFKSGVTITCTELETMAPEFIAKCLMLT